MSKYIMSKKFDSDQRATARSILDREIKKNTPFNEIERIMRSNGVGYNRQNMQYDVRLKKASYHQSTDKNGITTYKTYSTPKARKNAVNWFTDVYEPFRKSNGLSSSQATDLIQQDRQMTRKLSRDEHLLTNDYRDRYEKVFG